MARYIEYYEYRSQDEYRHIYVWPHDEQKTEYFYMPVDKMALNKKNLDDGSSRIWKYDTWFDKVYYEKYNGKTGDRARNQPVDMDEFNRIVLQSDSCPYSYSYETAQRLRNKGIIK